MFSIWHWNTSLNEMGGFGFHVEMKTQRAEIAQDQCSYNMPSPSQL